MAFVYVAREINRLPVRIKIGWTNAQLDRLRNYVCSSDHYWEGVFWKINHGPEDAERYERLLLSIYQNEITPHGGKEIIDPIAILRTGWLRLSDFNSDDVRKAFFVRSYYAIARLTAFVDERPLERFIRREGEHAPWKKACRCMTCCLEHREIEIRHSWSFVDDSFAQRWINRDRNARLVYDRNREFTFQTRHAKQLDKMSRQIANCQVELTELKFSELAAICP